MDTEDFSVKCHSCGGRVHNWTQSITYTLTNSAAYQAGQTIYLSCGCAVDFPDWKINLDTGWCKIIDYTGRLFIEFLDEELLMEEDED